MAAVRWHLISPANNSSIVGIFQDSLLGSYQFTRNNIKFTARDAMNLLMSFKKVDLSKLTNLKEITSFELLTQILPPLTIKYKTNGFKDGYDFKTSNSVQKLIMVIIFVVN